MMTMNNQEEMEIALEAISEVETLEAPGMWDDIKGGAKATLATLGGAWLLHNIAGYLILHL